MNIDHICSLLFRFSVFLLIRIPSKHSPVDYKQLQGFDCFCLSVFHHHEGMVKGPHLGACWNCRTFVIPPKTTTLGYSCFFYKILGHSYVQLKFEKHCDSVSMPHVSLVECENYIIFCYKLCYGLNCIPLKIHTELGAMTPSECDFI